MSKKYHFTNLLTLFAFVLFIIISFINIAIIIWFPKNSIFAYIFMIVFAIFCWLSFLYLFIISLQTTKIDKKGIIQQNPLREAIILKWKDIKQVCIIKFIFKSIYISEKNYSDGEIIHLSPFIEENKLIRIRYSKKILKEIQKYYNNESDKK